MTRRSSRTLIIGDVHGCYDELRQLADKCEYTPHDRIISLGDVVDRGPSVREAVDFFMQRDRPEERSAILGNHEERLLKYYVEWQKKGAPTNPEVIKTAIKFRADYHATSFLALTPEHFEWFKTLPKFLKLPEYTAPDGLPVTLVHAGCLPQVPIEDNTDLIRLHCSDIMPPAEGLDLDQGMQHGYWKAEVSTWWTSKAPPGAKFWAALYDGASGHVVFGHSGFKRPAEFPHATGIDLGAVFGNELCALILPEWRFVTVKARQAYKSRRTGKVKLYEVYPGIEVYS